jgi:hypothetical protein
MEALRVAPYLVATESPIVAFWRCENQNPWGAAHRLVDYWKRRKQFFGEKAFLPMAMGAAMSGDDLDALHIGLIQLLPDDESGRPVFYWDRIRSVASVVQRESLVRTFFYLFQVMAERESGQRNGFSIMIFLKVKYNTHLQLLNCFKYT